MTMTAAGQNDPRLTTPVRVEVLRSMWVDGVRREPGDVVELPRDRAIDAASVGRVRILTN